MTVFTRQDVRELMLDQFGLGRRGTNSGISDSAITDLANFSGPAGAEDIDVGCEVMITSGTGAPADEFARLNGKPNRITGVMPLDRTLTAALASGDTFEVLYRELSFDTGPHSIHQAINDALAGPSIPWELRRLPITLAANGDMLLEDEEAGWTAFKATLSRLAGSFPLGFRALAVLATDDNGQARSTAIAVEGGETYFLEATGLLSTAGGATEGTLILWDSTNAEAISLTNTDITAGDPTILMNTSVVIPATTKVVSVYLQTDTDTGVVAWANVILRKNSAREFTIQDRPVRILRLGRLLATRLGTWGLRGDRWDEIPAERVQVDSGIWQYHTDVNLAGVSVWYEEYIEPVALTADSDTTNVNKHELAAVAAELVLRPLARSKKWQDRYAAAVSMAASVRLNFESRRTVADERTRFYPVARV